jgi:molecular chaperone HscB
VFGLGERLEIDLEGLRERFYSLSKATHPDKYSGREGMEEVRAARWSSAINRAYQTLREPELRAAYLLERYAIPSKGGVPMELAESYFELQDLLSEDSGKDALTAFASDMQKRLDSTESAWTELCLLWERESDKRKVLEQVSKHFTLRRFLQSMLSDIESKRSKW